MGRADTVKVYEICRVAPPPGSVSEATLPLSFFDVIWVLMPPVQRLFFYGFSAQESTTTHFFESIVPSLKHSLSLALQIFYPLAGNLALSLETGEQEICYVDGDSVALTVAETTAHFHHLIGNHTKHATEHHPLVPQLPTSALLSLQVTLFPSSGISIGITLHHVVADGRSLTHFMKSWASICRTGDGSSIAVLPVFDRSLIHDPKGLKKIYTTQMAELKGVGDPEALNGPNQAHLVRATFVLGRAQIEKMRKWVLARRPETAHCSTFVLTCAHVWVCLVKARGDLADKPVHFYFAADYRARLDPPVPDTYFGNCIGACFADAKASDLAREDGLATATDSIGRAIRGLAEGAMVGAERWILNFVEVANERIVTVAGSPKFRVYDTDFGWGRPIKTEVLSIEKNGAIYVGESPHEEGGIEIGTALSKSEMDSFASFFEADLL